MYVNLESVAIAILSAVLLLVMAYLGPNSKTTKPCDMCNENDQMRSFRLKFQPRGALARALYTKQVTDCQLERMDHSKWYRVDESRLSPEMRETFLPMSEDEETIQFLDNCVDKSDWLFTQIWHSIVKTILRWFLTQTDINGLLGRGSMFIFSKAQLQRLLGRSLAQTGELLDLGAGDGLITQNIANFFTNVFVTEVSRPMRWALKKRGFQVLEVDKWTEHQYDAVSCLNLLDRCDRPHQILQDIRRALKPNGTAIFAFVLPYQPFVESSGNANKPSESLLIQGTTLEEQAMSVIKNVLEPSGFTVERWSRMPYLCEGDLHQSYYWLDDVVFIARAPS